MITGYNTDVRHGDCLLHVQTEDRPGSRPRIETIVYQAGEILHSRRSRYDDLAGQNPFPVDLIRSRMDAQHHLVVLETSAGCFSEGDDPEDLTIRSAAAFRPLPDLLLKTLLEAEASPDAISLEFLAPILGSDPNVAEIQVRVVRASSGLPIAGAAISTRLGSAADPEAEVVRAKTDADGIYRAMLPIPVPAGPKRQVQVLVQCAFGPEQDEARAIATL